MSDNPMVALDLLEALHRYVGAEGDGPTSGEIFFFGVDRARRLTGGRRRIHCAVPPPERARVAIPE
jgi:hypothetical protein